MTYKTEDQVRDEANVPIHKLMFQKMKIYVNLKSQDGLYGMRLKTS